MTANPTVASAPAEAAPAEAASREDNPGSARERIFRTARELFYRQGIRAVGVEAIAAEAGTTKMSLYRNFASKDELVAACLQDQDREFWEWWDSVLAPYEGQPRRQIEALFAAFESRACREKAERGCPIANAAVEIIDDAHPARRIVEEHHAEIRRRLRGLCAALGARQADRLGDSLMLLMGGAFMSRLVFADAGPVESVAEAARVLLESDLAGRGG